MSRTGRLLLLNRMQDSFDVKRIQSHAVIPVGTSVVVDNGGGRIERGIVLHWSPKRNALGNAGNYAIRVTGGTDVFGKPARIGQCRTSVLCTHVRRQA
jgi:hypothetical protein